MGASTRFAAVCLLLVAAASMACAGESLTNSTGHEATGLRIVFSTPVTIREHAESLPNQSPVGKSSEFLFSGGRVRADSAFSLTWQPAEARIVDYEWQYRGSDQDKVIAFADLRLEAAICEAVSRSAGHVRGAELSGLTELTASGIGLTDLSGIEAARDLTSLDVSQNYIAELSPLGDLTDLTSLNLNENEVEDLSALQGLTALTELYVAVNQVRDVGPLSSLPKLRTLSISANPLSDLTPLAHLKDLERLLIAGVGARDVAFLSGLASLTYLDISGNEVADLSPLDALGELVYLFIGANPVASLAPLGSLVKLAKLVADGSEVADVSPLVNLAGLRELILDLNRIRDVRGLASLKQLSYLSLTHNHIADLTPLAGSTALRTLCLGHNEISDITPLAGLSGLEFLELNDNHIRSLDALGGMSGLRSVKLGGNEVAVFPVFRNPGRVFHLDLSGNKLVDLRNFPGKMIEGDPGVGIYGSYDFSCLFPTIDLSGNELTDLAPLVLAMNEKTGHFVDLRGNPLASSAGSPVAGQLDALRKRQSAVCVGSLVTTENFAHAGTWEQGPTGTGTRQVTGEQYEISLQPGSSEWTWNPSMGVFGDQIRISIDAEWLTDEPVKIGILTHIRDGGGAAFGFYLKSSGAVSFGEFDYLMGWRDVVGWTPCPVGCVKAGTNKLTLILDGHSIAGEVNGVRVLEVAIADDPWYCWFDVGYVGFAAQNDSASEDVIIRFDNLVIEELR